ncbi:MAG TPA: cytochrome P450 [Microbacterium sp.]|uniref:cytochrome P450 n=1 Tax=Microbacterium sp. TaxID=51671 RepID=UPI002D06A756|nr:cytochrome P450 [Microbacterium sp.]HWI30546.1 cytochrome P450 [Microbacterium sp.]
MPLHSNIHDETTDLDISSYAFWAKTFDEREETFAALRAEHPVSWHRPLEEVAFTPEQHGQTGFWAVTRAEDITFVSQHHELFSSELGHTILRPGPPEAQLAMSFLELDPPRHTAFRKIMSAGFTPKAVARLSDKIEERAAQIVDRVVGAGPIDFVAEVSSRLPMMTVADLVGVPESLMETFATAGDDIVRIADPTALRPDENPIEVAQRSFGTIAAIGAELGAARRQTPQDDIMTALVSAEIDGEKLSDQDIMMVLVLLSVAGNDTTKQTTTRTVIQFDRHPDQRAWLMEDFDGRITGAIEEFVRHASPVIQFARTATQDVELGGQQILAGDKVGIFYCSGNRDERVFTDPAKFDLSRGRTPHVGFGGGGVHYCLGNGVAKAQLRALFQQILTKLPDIEVGEPEYLGSDFINGVNRLPVVIR